MRFNKLAILDLFRRQELVYQASLVASNWLNGGDHYKPSAIDDARGGSFEIRGEWVSFSAVADALESPGGKIRLTTDFALNQLHALIRTPFELLDDYCEDFDKGCHKKTATNNLRGTTWYYFARLIRNAISHNFRYEFRDSELQHLPISWNGITISADMNGTEMTYRFWHKPGYMLFLEMRDFAKSLPEPAETNT